MIRISLKTKSGYYLIAEDSRRGHTINAVPRAAGPWETFTIYLADGRNDNTLRSGDQIFLQTHHGRYLTARDSGGSTLNGEGTYPSSWHTFTIQRDSGEGEIAQDDLVTLRASNEENYVMAVNGGGGAVNAESRNWGDWELFAVEFWNTTLVRLSAQGAKYLSAEDGGGREINANRNVANIWETFTLVNRSQRSGLSDGNKICLQTWNGKFLSAVGGGGGNLLANQNRASDFETFTILKRNGGNIARNDRIWLRTHDRTHYVMAEGGGGGIVRASATLPGDWETFLLWPGEQALTFADAPSLPSRAGHPLPSPPRRITGHRKLMCFVIGFEDKPVDDSITINDIRSFFFGPRSSIAEWVEKTSYGAFSITEAGVFGPMTVPWPYVEKPEQEYFSGLLRLAEEQARRRDPAHPFRFRDLAEGRRRIPPPFGGRDGLRTLTGDEVMFVVMDCTDLVSGGQKEDTSFRYDGVAYAGRKLTVGLYTKQPGAIQGRRQLENVFGTITHEMSHMMFSTPYEIPDRYYSAYPPRGDVIATSRNRLQWETFALLGSSGVALSGARVRLQVVTGGDYLVLESRDRRRYLNRGGVAGDPLGLFIIERIGATSVNHGDEIYLKSAATNEYLMAVLGGGDIVKTFRGRPRPRETFIIERIAGAGPVSFGDSFTLRTSNQNPFATSFYLMAEPGGRLTSPEILSRGWLEKSFAGDGVGGDFDIMDNDKMRGMQSAYDRIKRGWITAKVLTPDNKACYVLKPSIERPEAFVLWDPAAAEKEWYVVENRQRRLGLDECPSSGLIITWVNEDPAYWGRWRHNGAGKFPAVISAAAPTAIPNNFIQPVLSREVYYRRRDPNTAFRSGTTVLPRGDGSPSRFVLSFFAVAPGEIAFCIL